MRSSGGSQLNMLNVLIKKGIFGHRDIYTGRVLYENWSYVVRSQGNMRS